MLTGPARVIVTYESGLEAKATAHSVRHSREREHLGSGGAGTHEVFEGREALFERLPFRQLLELGAEPC